MKPTILVDAGPLVAVVDRRDHFHAWAVTEGQHLPETLLCCEPVIAEACFIVRKMPGCVAAILEMIERGKVAIPFRLEAHVKRVDQLLAHYTDVPMSLADACLVRMAEIYDDASVWTIDSDFSIYRKHNRQVIPTIVPEP